MVMEKVDGKAVSDLTSVSQETKSGRKLHKSYAMPNWFMMTCVLKTYLSLITCISFYVLHQKIYAKVTLFPRC